MTSLLLLGLLILSVSFILKKKEPILGGRIWQKYENEILAGVLIILLYRNGYGDVLKGADIHSEVMGSDHCPIVLEINCLKNGTKWVYYFYLE